MRERLNFGNYFMAKVVPNQHRKFETDELLRKLSRECEVRYAGARDKTSKQERMAQFQEDCKNGIVDIVFVVTGTNLTLTFTNHERNGNVHRRDRVDYRPDNDQVHIISHFILDGVCVRWKGWIETSTLEGFARLEFDEDMAQIEDNLLQSQLAANHQFELEEAGQSSRLPEVDRRVSVDTDEEIDVSSVPSCHGSPIASTSSSYVNPTPSVMHFRLPGETTR